MIENGIIVTKSKVIDTMTGCGGSLEIHLMDDETGETIVWRKDLMEMVEEAEEAKQSDPPPIIEETEPEAIETYPESRVHVREDRLQTHLNQVPPQLEQTPPSVFQDETISAQLEAAKVAPGRLQASPVYQSPIYSANIGQQIANDLNAARQGVVASIILNPPKALEDPEKATRY